MHPLKTVSLSRLAGVVFAGALALALAACGGSKDASGSPEGKPVADVAAPSGQMWSDVVAATDDGGMRMGNPDAQIKLVEYGSLSCPHCAKLAQDGMDTLVSKYVNSGRVSYEFRSYAIHGVLDLPMTVLVKCDSPQTFFPLVEQIYRNYDSIVARAEAGNDKAKAAQNLPADQRWPALADAFGLTDFFAARGLPVDQAHKCLANADAAQKIADQTEAWFKAGISSTPTLFINGVKMDDIHEWTELEPALQRAGAR